MNGCMLKGEYHIMKVISRFIRLSTDILKLRDPQKDVICFYFLISPSWQKAMYFICSKTLSFTLFVQFSILECFRVATR